MKKKDDFFKKLIKQRRKEKAISLLFGLPILFLVIFIAFKAIQTVDLQLTGRDILYFSIMIPVVVVSFAISIKIDKERAETGNEKLPFLPTMIFGIIAIVIFLDIVFNLIF